MAGVAITPITDADADALIAANRASIELHRPWVHPFTDRAGFARYFAGLDGERRIGLIARNLDDGQIVGVFTLSEIVRRVFQNAYIGFYGIQGQVGRGLMTQALRATLAHAFGDLDLHRVEANVRPENERSRALIERAGFRREGYSPDYLYLDGAWRDHERWAILATEFDVREG